MPSGQRKGTLLCTVYLSTVINSFHKHMSYPVCNNMIDAIPEFIVEYDPEIQMDFPMEVSFFKMLQIFLQMFLLIF